MSDSRPPLAGMVLAGGASRRMGSAKAALRLGGRSFLEIALGRLAHAGCQPLVVVVGHAIDAVRAALPPTPPAEIVVNPQPDRGQLSSLQVGLTHLARTPSPSTADGIQGVLVSLIDQPAIRAETFGTVADRLRDVLTASAQGGAARAIVLASDPTVGRGHPVGLCRAIWSEVVALDPQGPGGLRALLQRVPQRIVEVAVDDPAIGRDVDTPDDLAQLVREFVVDGQR